MPKPAPAAPRVLACALLVLALCLVPQGWARAANMVHHDLTSLALDSDAIVLARVADGSTHEILESYFGALEPGQQIEVERQSYAIQDPWAGPDAQAPSDEVVLFLVGAADLSCWGERRSKLDARGGWNSKQRLG